MSIVGSDASILAKDLSLSFPINYYAKNSWRDAFISTFQKPFNKFQSQKEVISVLKGLNFTINPGERVGVIGLNGTGKTSLCRCIAGMYKPTSGRIEINGKVRCVFSSVTGFFPELTGRENAELLVQLHYPEVKNKKGLLWDALQFSELGRLLDIPYKFYSNGMQIRLALSILSSMPSEILVLDEVFNGADLFFRQKVTQRMLNTIEKSSIVVFVSHDIEQVLKICNRILLLNDGKIVFDGNVEEGLKLYAGVGSGASLVSKSFDKQQSLNHPGSQS